MATLGDTQHLNSEHDLLLKVLEPDGFLAVAVVLAAAMFCVIAIATKPKTANTGHSKFLVLAARLFSVPIFLIQIASTSAAIRLLYFLFGPQSGGDGNTAGVMVFSVIFMVPALFCLGIACGCAKAMHFLFSLKR